MSETNPPPVAPVEGHYALLRNGMVVKHLVDMWDAHRGPKTKRDYWTAHPDTDFSDLCWHEDGKSRDDSDYDIIATISPADMQAVASGELERLRAALNDIFEMWAGSEGFIPHTAPEGYLLMLVKKMADRAALAKQGNAP